MDASDPGTVLSQTEKRELLDTTTFIEVPEIPPDDLTTSGWAPKASRAPRDFVRGRLSWAASSLRGLLDDKARETAAHEGGSEGVFVVKLQTPQDNSHDSMGGIGPMTPTTLLLTSHPFAKQAAGKIGREIDEDEKGHTALARLAIRHRGTVFLYCALVPDPTSHGLWSDIVAQASSGSRRRLKYRLYADILPNQHEVGW